MEATADFIFYVFDREQEDLLWQQYLRTDMLMSFKEFKSKQKVRDIRSIQKQKPISKIEEKNLLNFAKATLFSNEKGGEN